MLDESHRDMEFDFVSICLSECAAGEPQCDRMEIHGRRSQIIVLHKLYLILRFEINIVFIANLFFKKSFCCRICSFKMKSL